MVFYACVYPSAYAASDLTCLSLCLCLYPSENQPLRVDAWKTLQEKYKKKNQQQQQQQTNKQANMGFQVQLT